MFFRKSRREMQKCIENLVIEKLSQDEEGFPQTPGGRYLIKKFKQDETFSKIYEDYKKKGSQ